MARVRVSNSLVVDTKELGPEGLRVAILARSGAGKSNLAALFCEQAIEQGWQVVILEPISEWHTLKAKYHNVICVGGPYADIPLLHEFHARLVDFLADTNASMVINLADLNFEEEMKRFTANFLWALYVKWQKIRRPILLVVEEADMLAPQMWSREDKPSLSRISLIAKHGRKLGINLILISQRPSDLHKSPLSQANVLFFGSFKSAQDLDPKQGIMWIAKKLGIPITAKEITELGTGEFYTWYRNQVLKIKALLRKTPHGGETPTELKQPTGEVGKALSQLKHYLEEIIEKERREKNEIQRLRAENEQLKQRIKELEEIIKTTEIVKKVPMKIEAEPVKIETKVVETKTIDNNITPPDSVIASRYKQAPLVWSKLREHPEGITMIELSAETGLGRETLRKILKWMKRKGLARLKTTKGLKPKIIKAYPRR